MSKPANLQALVERYLRERRRLGFGMRDAVYALRSFARHLDTIEHHRPLTTEIMTDWARRDKRGTGDPRTWARRLRMLRSFARWLQQFEPRTEVPDDAIFGRLSERLAPHIYSEREIVDLLRAARRLGLAPGLRGATYEALFGLIASTGLRLSEALQLRNVDVDLKQGIRQVLMHPATVKALRHFRSQRDLSVDGTDDTSFFVTARGRRRGQNLNERQVHRVFAALREQLGWRNRGAHHAPRIHDLRHTFVVRRILLWQTQGVDIDQAMLSLSTYVGHAKITNTYWYLSAVPELMALAAATFESFLTRQEVADA